MALLFACHFHFVRYCGEKKPCTVKSTMTEAETDDSRVTIIFFLDVLVQPNGKLFSLTFGSETGVTQRDSNPHQEKETVLTCSREGEGGWTLANSYLNPAMTLSVKQELDGVRMDDMNEAMQWSSREDIHMRIFWLSWSVVRSWQPHLVIHVLMASSGEYVNKWTKILFSLYIEDWRIVCLPSFVKRAIIAAHLQDEMSGNLTVKSSLTALMCVRLPQLKSGLTVTPGPGR